MKLDHHLFFSVTNTMTDITLSTKHFIHEIHNYYQKQLQKSKLHKCVTTYLCLKTVCFRELAMIRNLMWLIHSGLQISVEITEFIIVKLAH